ncbi:MAG: NHLP bacteriocin export ABC transporter permease/ATPase subunit [Acidobacteriota bacterium]
MDSKMQSVFREEGSTSTIGGNEPFLLDGPAKVWFVQSGTVDVFAVRLDAAETASPRRHVFRVEAGGILIGVHMGDAQPGLLAVGFPGTEVSELSATRFFQLAEDSQYAPELACLLDGWVCRFWSGAHTGLAPRRFKPMTAGTVLELRGGEAALCTGAVLWAVQSEGSSSFAWWEELPAAEEKIYFPVPTGAWLTSLGESKLTVTDTLAALASGSCMAGLDRFHRMAVDAVSLNIERSEQMLADGQLKAATADQLSLHGALMRLGSVLEPRGEHPVFAETEIDPLVAACRAVGGLVNIGVVTPPSWKSKRRGPDPLDEIARASRFRVRRVALRDDWWRRDNGPLLAYVQEGEDRRRPVALLPRSPQSYGLYDPTTGQTEMVGTDQAATIAPFAYGFTAPFAERTIRLPDVLRFGLEGSGSDLRTLLLMSILVGLLGLVTPLATGQIFNKIIPGAERSEHLQLILVLVASSLATGGFLVARSIALLRLEGKMDARLQAAVWDRLLSLPAPFFRRYSAGDLAMRANAFGFIRQVLTDATVSSILGGVFSVFNILLLFYYSWRLTLVAIGLTVVAMIVMGVTGRMQIRFQRQLFEQQGRIGGMLLQFISGISKLRVAGAERRAFACWGREFAAQKTISYASGRVANSLVVFNSVLMVLTWLIIFWVMSSWSGARMRTGDFVAFNSAFGSFLVAALAMSASLVSVLSIVPVFERARPIIETMPEVDQAKSHPGELSGELEVSHVSFRYTADGPLILDDVAFHVRPGEFVALVGPSGSGKSTIFRLLLGFEAPDSGSIYYDHQDISGLDLSALRRQMGVVLQSGELMTGDILTNITGASLLTEEDAWEAARLAGIEQDIREMPMGMQTVVSEGGGGLSGGQRQRLLIARAVVNKPRILLFDEATSALDNRTQALVSASLLGLRASRIVIAHRLSTVMKADTIHVIDGGRVVESGSYDELMRRDGLFAQLARRQLT